MAEICRAVAVGDQGFERTVAIKRIREEVARGGGHRQAVRRRGPAVGAAGPPEHRAGLRLRGGGRDLLHRHGVPARGATSTRCCSALRRTASGWRRRWRCSSPARWPGGWPTPTPCATSAAGRYDIVHRDVSPANIMLLQAGAVKLLDFGIARVTSELRLAVTQGRALRGKCPYLAPEQITGGTVDGRADIFALGVVLWEMLTGQRLFGGESDLRHHRQRAEPGDPAAVGAGARRCRPRWIESCMGALARDPSRRYRLGRRHGGRPGRGDARAAQPPRRSAGPADPTVRSAGGRARHRTQ